MKEKNILKDHIEETLEKSMFALSYILSDKKIKLKHNLNSSVTKY